MRLQYSLLGNYIADTLYRECLDLDWVEEKSARREYFMSAVPRQYQYGNRHTGVATYHSQPLAPGVRMLMATLNQNVTIDYNVCFLNRYDSEKQHLGWHADDSPLMIPDSEITVVSLGAERYIHFKEKSLKGVLPDSNKQLLEHGSVWVMPEGFQNTHVHKIPKHSEPCGTRISLTFRKFQ